MEDFLVAPGFENDPGIDWDNLMSVLDDPTDDFDQSSATNSGNKRRRKSNPDAGEIAKATEAALMKLGLDPKSEEFKLKKRQIRNRISAQSHRDRKNGHIQKLEGEMSLKDKKIAELQEENLKLKTENESLRQQLSMMFTAGPGHPIYAMTRTSGYVSSGSSSGLDSGNHSPFTSSTSTTTATAGPLIPPFTLSSTSPSVTSGSLTPTSLSGYGTGCVSSAATASLVPPPPPLPCLAGLVMKIEPSTSSSFTSFSSSFPLSQPSSPMPIQPSQPQPQLTTFGISWSSLLGEGEEEDGENMKKREATSTIAAPILKMLTMLAISSLLFMAMVLPWQQGEVGQLLMNGQKDQEERSLGSEEGYNRQQSQQVLAPPLLLVMNRSSSSVVEQQHLLSLTQPKLVVREEQQQGTTRALLAHNHSSPSHHHHLRHRRSLRAATAATSYATAASLDNNSSSSNSSYSTDLMLYDHHHHHGRQLLGGGGTGATGTWSQRYYPAWLHPLAASPSLPSSLYDDDSYRSHRQGGEIFLAQGFFLVDPRRSAAPWSYPAGYHHHHHPHRSLADHHDPQEVKKEELMIDEEEDQGGAKAAAAAAAASLIRSSSSSYAALLAPPRPSTPTPTKLGLGLGGTTIALTTAQRRLQLSSTADKREERLEGDEVEAKETNNEKALSLISNFAAASAAALSSGFPHSHSLVPLMRGDDDRGARRSNEEEEEEGLEEDQEQSKGQQPGQVVVTLTLPAALIQLGSSLQESRAFENIEHLLALFNMTKTALAAPPAAGAASSPSSSPNVSSLAAQDPNLFVEMSCVILDAKLLWRQQQQATPPITMEADMK